MNPTKNSPIKCKPFKYINQSNYNSFCVYPVLHGRQITDLSVENIYKTQSAPNFN